MEGSGLSEVGIESGLFGRSAVELALAGKDYSKAMRAHKLTIQALWRMMIPHFLRFIAESDQAYHN